MGKYLIAGLFSLMLYFPATYGQQSWQLEAAYTQGNFYSHARFRAPLSRPVRSLEASIIRPTNGRNYWQHLHNYPDMGLRFRARDMGNSAVYGYLFSLIPYVGFYPWRKEHWGVHVTHGTGLCYISKTYSESNPENQLISSHLNAATFLNIGIYYQPQVSWRIAATLEFSHESNGNFKKNNRGFNVWAAGIALRHNLNGPVEKLPFITPSGTLKRWLFSAELSAGLHDYDTETRQLKVSPEVTVALWRQHHDRFRSYLGVGYNVYPFPLIEQAAFIMIGEEVMLGALSVRYSLGTYLTFTGPKLRWIEKVGISYYPFKNAASINKSRQVRVARGMYIGSYLKAHGSVAAHVEFTVGNVF